MTADRMRADEWDYRPFSEEFAEASAAADEGWAKYCDDVEKTAAWGGQLELGALAKALRRSIVVFSARMPKVTMGEEFAAGGAAAGVLPAARVWAGRALQLHRGRVAAESCRDRVKRCSRVKS